MSVDLITPVRPFPPIAALPAPADVRKDAGALMDVLANALQRAIALDVSGKARDHLVADYVSGAACVTTEFRPSLSIWLRLVVSTIAKPYGADGVAIYLDAVRRFSGEAAR